jgi:type II secretory pathway component PulC
VKVEQPRPVALFVLNGIIRDKKNPLAMTDRGLFGVGDTVDGYKILSIADDQVMVQGDSGRQETVKLYSEKRPSDEQNTEERDGSPRSETR